MRKRRRRVGSTARRRSRRSRKSLLLVFALVFAATASRPARAACLEFSDLVPVTGVANGASSVRAADVDGDGDMDMLASAFADNAILFYDNFDITATPGSGDGTIWDTHTITTFAPFANSVFAADVDGDGDVDALSASFGGIDKIMWYKNVDATAVVGSGDGTTWSALTVSLAVNGALSVFAADVDGDGDTDALSASYSDDKIAWYDNLDLTTPGTGDGSTWTQHVIATDANGAASVFAADVDGDGDTDVLSATYLGDEIAWHDNVDLTTPGTGDGSTWTKYVIAADAYGAYSVFAADVDGDGDVDALSASKLDGQIRWYENVDATIVPGSGDGTTWSLATISADAVGADSVVAADLDGDGDLDALASSEGDTRFAWHENLAPGNGSAWTVHTLASSGNGPVSVFAADVDGDGDTDALFTEYIVDIVGWYRNERLHDQALLDTTSTIAVTPLALAIVAADVDGDGDIDALASTGSANQNVVWYANDGSGDGWTLHLISTVGVFGVSVVAADVDGDGDLDAVSAGLSYSENGRVSWHENLAPGDGSSWASHTVASLNSAQVVFAADVDGDGDLDVLSTFANAQKLAWYENLPPGNGSSWTLRTISLAVDFPRSVVGADVDGDGDLDVLFGAPGDDRIAWYENLLPGDGSSWSVHTISLTADQVYSVFAADVDSDGDIDALSASRSDDKIAWYENLSPGNGTGWTIHTISLTAEGAGFIFAADVDGDGDTDALSASAGDNKIEWYENASPGNGSSWTAHTISLTADLAYSVFAADVDGDGDLDALSASMTDGKIAWYPNLGTGVFDDGFDSDGNDACWSSAH